MNFAINGFGRIGRQALKIALDKGINIVAVNDLTRADELAHLLKFDSVYGIYEREVKAVINGQTFVAGQGGLLKIEKADLEHANSQLVVGDKSIKVLSIKDPAQLPWQEMGIDVVLECTGIFDEDDAAAAHITAGAKHVVISAPSKGSKPAPIHVLGVNDTNISAQVISTASCTTNCAAPVAKVINDAFGIDKAMLSTIHAVTNTQKIVDSIDKDLRRARSGMINIVPTTTGAAEAVVKTMPGMEGKFDGLSIRVPIITGSLIDFTFVTSRETSVEEVNQAFTNAASSEQYKGILEVSNAPLVSTDIIGNPASAIVDLEMTKVVGGNLVKVMAWYDNEWGYSNRLVEIAAKIAG